MSLHCLVILFNISRCVFLTAVVSFPHGLAGNICSETAPIRNAKGLLQDDLAYEAEISGSYLSQIEKGSFHVSLKIIGKLAEALGVEPAEFLKINKRKARE